MSIVWWMQHPCEYKSFLCFFPCMIYRFSTWYFQSLPRIIQARNSRSLEMTISAKDRTRKITLMVSPDRISFTWKLFQLSKATDVIPWKKDEYIPLPQHNSRLSSQNVAQKITGLRTSICRYPEQMLISPSRSFCSHSSTRRKDSLPANESIWPHWTLQIG